MYNSISHTLVKSGVKRDRCNNLLQDKPQTSSDIIHVQTGGDHSKTRKSTFSLKTTNGKEPAITTAHLYEQVIILANKKPAPVFEFISL